MDDAIERLPAPPAADGAVWAAADGDVWAVPWRIRDCLVVVALTVVGVVVALLALQVVDVALGLPEELTSILLPLPLTVLALVTVAWVGWRHRAARQLTGPRRATLGTWAKGLGLGLLAFIAVNVALSLVVQVGAGLVGVDLPTPQRDLREAAGAPELAPWLAVSAIVVAPVAEELFFRGMLFPALRRPLGRWLAIVVSAFVFAGAHLLGETSVASGVLTVVMILPLGVALAWLYDRAGTIGLPIAVHAAFNAVTVGVMVLAAREGVLA